MVEGRRLDFILLMELRDIVVRNLTKFKEEGETVCVLCNNFTGRNEIFCDDCRARLEDRLLGCSNYRVDLEDKRAKEKGI